MVSIVFSVTPPLLKIQSLRLCVLFFRAPRARHTPVTRACHTAVTRLSHPCHRCHTLRLNFCFLPPLLILEKNNEAP